MVNVIVMRVPKDKLQQEIEHKALDGWKLRKNERENERENERNESLQ